GIGIPPEIMENICTPFYSTKEKGQGIGLTMVQEILSKHNFSFSIVSDPGKSTKFTVFFSNPSIK
ncbi:MAG: histidine kinase, partial [bacterium]|nr:histidine kinase [bacterium]